MIDLLLRAEVLTLLVVAATAAIVVSVVIRFTRDRDGLSRRVKKVDKQLQRLRKEIAAKQGRITELQSAVEMLKPLEASLNAYYEQLMRLQLEQERKDMQEGKDKAEGEAEEDEWDFGRKRQRVSR